MKENSNSKEGIARRPFLGALGATSTAAIAGMAGCAGVGGGSGDSSLEIPDDPDGAVEGSSLSVAIDEGQNTLPLEWFNDPIKEDTGIEIGEINGFGFTNLYSNLMTEFTSGSGAFDLVSFYPQFLGTFAANDHLV